MRKKKIGEPFVSILKSMIDSPAFKSIGNASRVTYLLLRAQVRKYGQNDVCLPFNYAGAFMNRNTFLKSIKELEEFGFIETIEHGALNHRPNIYRLIDQWRNIKETSKREKRREKNHNILAYSIRSIKSDTDEFREQAGNGIKTDTYSENAESNRYQN